MCKKDNMKQVVKVIKYIAGSLILSFGVLFVLVILLRSLQIEAPKDSALYLGSAWILLAIVIYPFAKKIVRV